MKVLWITNIIFPDACEELGLPMPVFGGWMFGLSTQLAAQPGIQLAVATVYKGNTLQTIEVNNITYHLLPSKGTQVYRSELEKYWVQVCDNYQPDLIHIHGTEYAHGLACMRACPAYHYVISIQGLIHKIAEHYYAGIRPLEILKNVTIRDVIKRDTIIHAKKSFEKRGLIEKEYFSRVKHVIGRTKWDHDCVKAIKPSVNYHFCNESLRNVFYEAPKWDIAKTNRYSIFISQAAYPIKGFHKVLEALGYLIDVYPDIKVRVAGHNFVNFRSRKDYLRQSGYGAYIKRLIKKYKLHHSIEFLGSLNEKQMIYEYSKAHLFICPSSIENSPNSVGEAQLLGVPVIASNVGGVSDMVEDNISGFLYSFNESSLLAKYIDNCFSNPDLLTRVSENSISIAEERHNSFRNLQVTLAIYNCIANDESCMQ